MKKTFITPHVGVQNIRAASMICASVTISGTPADPSQTIHAKVGDMKFSAPILEY